jgi:hypothetical protein
MCAIIFYNLIATICLIKRREHTFQKFEWLVVGVFEKEQNNMFLINEFNF